MVFLWGPFSLPDRTLLRVRPDFVGRVNEAVIRQLLDGLLCKEVLNDEEVEEVKQGGRKQDQARALIDHVRRKGPKASAVFLQELQSCDGFLAGQLGLTRNPAGG